MAVVTYLSYHRRKRWRFDWGASEFKRPTAQVIQSGILPRLIPIPRPGPDTVIHDQLQTADLLKKQIAITKDRHLQAKVLMAWREAELRLGEEEAARQLWLIVNEYLRDKAA